VRSALIRRHKISRRDFLKLAAVSAGGLSVQPWQRVYAQNGFNQSERLARVVWWGTELKTRPDISSTSIRALQEDELLPWLREIVGPYPTDISQRWVETTQGYLWSPHVQMVKNQPTLPLATLPITSVGEGMWAEVSVPFVDLVLDNPPARAPWLEYRLANGPYPRLYYSQIVWIDQIKIGEDGDTWYRVNEKYGYGDIFWAKAEAFRQITEDEITPIDSEVENKRIVVNVPYQTLSCFEGNQEVYFARISTGALYNAAGERVDAWATPGGEHPIWRKMISLHMSGGTTGGGWDLPGIGWTSLFVGNGVAIHSTFWHNHFGVPMSRGCVNAQPKDAKWIFRWTQPHVNYDPGDVTVPLPGGTPIEVIEA